MTTPEGQQPEETSADGRAMVPATPRDVVHIRLGSFVLVALIGISVIGFVSGLTWLLAVTAVLAVVVVVDMVLAMRRQSRARGGMPEAG
ncbi:hypothetical protein FHS43_001453 [Streptosporangium becharense]|uniref:Uncharacterized protein n=1 Tax=Streptosporangium becharense TaxID=1816182 RepID=A0A7W9ILI1_9ACTN|nr:hypothetical protein [Streptosporangium becharense]MBB2910190.1 hypothetical protein [Streptosporangium becharense]MBB5822933.1 hypothetical protein [Streptosporangium becharense]